MEIPSFLEDLVQVLMSPRESCNVPEVPESLLFEEGYT